MAPFLGWLAARDAGLPTRVDLFYVTSTRQTALFADELDAVSHEYPEIRVHHIHTSQSGRLTVQQIASLTAGPGTALDPTTDVFLCGPRPMIDDLAKALHRQGFPRDRIHYELFAFR